MNLVVQASAFAVAMVATNKFPPIPSPKQLFLAFDIRLGLPCLLCLGSSGSGQAFVVVVVLWTASGFERQKVDPCWSGWCFPGYFVPATRPWPPFLVSGVVLMWRSLSSGSWSLFHSSISTAPLWCWHNFVKEMVRLYDFGFAWGFYYSVIFPRVLGITTFQLQNTKSCRLWWWRGGIRPLVPAGDWVCLGVGYCVLVGRKACTISIACVETIALDYTCVKISRVILFFVSLSQKEILVFLVAALNLPNSVWIHNFSVEAENHLKKTLDVLPPLLFI